MEFNKYQEGALETVQYPGLFIDKDWDEYNPSLELNYIYPALGLVGEAGEVAEKVKKIIRDKLGSFGLEDVESIKKELGDVLWYVAVLAHEFGIKLDDVASTNYAKLKSRKERGKIQGSGDNR
jgi:NTP pyrophosphatase (non-canonical NTP hydrolase)